MPTQVQILLMGLLLTLFFPRVPAGAQESTRLEQLEGKLERLEQELGDLEKDVSLLENQVPVAEGASFWSTSTTQLSIQESSDQQRPGNGLYIYNAARFTGAVDQDTTARIMLFLQKGFGSERAYSAVSSMEAQVETVLRVGKNPWRVVIGHFPFEMTPLTLYRLYRKEDLAREQNLFRGVKASSSLANLDLTAFVAKNSDGAGLRMDRYMYALQASSRVWPNLPITLYHWQIGDDPHSLPVPGITRIEAITSIAGKYPLRFFNKLITLEGEVASYAKDNDTTDSLEATRDYALLLKGNYPLLVPSRGRWRLQPLQFTYQRIGPKYLSGGFAGVRDWEEDFRLDYEDNPYDFDYIRNFQSLAFNLPSLEIREGLVTTLNYSVFSELSPPAGAGRRVYQKWHADFTYSPRTAARGSSPFSWEGVWEAYLSRRKAGESLGELAVTNSWGGGYLRYEFNRETRLKIGPELWTTFEKGKEMRREFRPLFALTQSLFGNTTLELAYQPTSGFNQGGEARGYRWRVKIESSVGPQTSFSLNYRRNDEGTRYEQSLVLLYNTRY